MKLLKQVFIALVCIISFSACHKHTGKYNPFLHMKTKPSQQQIKNDKKVIKRGNRNYKKQLEHNRKYLFGRKHAPKQ